VITGGLVQHLECVKGCVIYVCVVVCGTCVLCVVVLHVCRECSLGLRDYFLGAARLSAFLR
jgi:hypothetical protein